MKKIITCFILLLAFWVPAHASEAEEVILTYERALQLAQRDLLSARESNLQIRQLEELQSDLQDEIREIENGTRLWQHTGDLYLMLQLVDEQINALQQGQETALLDTELAMAAFLSSGSNEQMLENLLSVMLNIFAAQNITNSLSTLESQRGQLAAEISRVYSGLFATELQETVRGELRDVNRSISDIQLRQAQTRINRENTLRTLIVTLAEWDVTAENAQRELELAEEELRRLQLRHELGRVSDIALETAQQNLELIRIDAEDILRQRSLTLQSLNHLLGQPLNQNTVIAVDFERLVMPENNSRFIAEVVSATPLIRQLQLDVNHARDTLQSFSGSNRQRRDNLQEALDIGRLTYEQARRELEITVQRLFTEMEGLVSASEALQLELNQAQNRLAVTEQSYSLGRVTAHDVNIAAFAVERTERELDLLRYKKWLLMFFISNPS